MTSALFQRKVPLHPVLSFLWKKKKNLGWGEELRKKRRKTPFASFFLRLLSPCGYHLGYKALQIGDGQ